MKGSTANYNSPEFSRQKNSSFVLQFAFIALFLVAMAANAMAFYTVLNQPWLEKLEPLLTLNGLLTFGPIEWTLRLVIALILGWNLLTYRGRRNWIEWLGFVLGGMTVIAGWGTLVANVSLVVSLAIWIIFQYIQFLSIQEGSNPGLRTIAIGLYLVEFCFQCIATPISPDDPKVLLVSFFAGTLNWSSIYWGLLMINIACMAGVEWLAKLYMLCLREVRYAN